MIKAIDWIIYWKGVCFALQVARKQAINSSFYLFKEKSERSEGSQRRGERKVRERVEGKEGKGRGEVKGKPEEREEKKKRIRREGKTVFSFGCGMELRL